jgi:hypothetical protein
VDKFLCRQVYSFLVVAYPVVELLVPMETSNCLTFSGIAKMCSKFSVTFLLCFSAGDGTQGFTHLAQG